VAAFGAAGWYFYTRPDGEQDLVGLALVLVVFSTVPIGFIHRQMRLRQEALVMPIVAQALGLTYSKDAKAFLRDFPKQLLPMGRTTAEDHVSTLVGTRSLVMAEVLVESRGSKSNRHRLFGGVVLRFPNRAGLPSFLLAPVMVARSGFAFGNFLSTDGYRHLRDLDLRGGSFGLWVSGLVGGESAALTAMVQVIAQLDQRIDPAYRLHSVCSTGAETYMALAHDRNLFHLGSLWPTETRVKEAVQNAAQDFAFLPAFIEALETAERGAGKS
jgi:hypothetical protein